MTTTVRHEDLDPTNRCTASRGKLRCTMHANHKGSHWDSLVGRAFRLDAVDRLPNGAASSDAETASHVGR